MRRYGHWISGAEVDSVGGNWMASTRPGTDVAVHEISLGDKADVDRAAAAAAGAVSGWWNREPIQRGRVLTAVAAQMRAEAETLAEMESAETGKPGWQTPLEVDGP